MNYRFWFRVMVVGYVISALILIGVWLYTRFAYGAQAVVKPQPIQTLNGGIITSTVAYPEQGRYYVRVKGDNDKVETWEVSKGFFDRAILGAPINRRDNTDD